MIFENKSIITLEPLACLRVEYLYNDCTLCLDSCPKDALLLDRRSRVEIKSDACIDCGICIGVCPRDALKSEEFDPNAYIIKEAHKDAVVLSCKEISKCLSVFNEEHLISLGLRNNNVACNMALCGDCPLNIEGKVQNDIQQKINQVNIFLEYFDFQPIRKEYASKELGRREALLKIFKETKDVFGDELSLDKEKNIPNYRTLFQNSLKVNIESMESRAKIDFRLSNISHKQIVYESCDNCGECVQFCPTKALIYSSDETKILFAPLHCISCSICNHICKPNAIYETNELDIISLAFDRAEILIEHTFAICSECNISFPQKKDEKICTRCVSFISENSDLFVLAKDI
ncbi:MAG: 4Fe-4S binding protein [Campylobacterales bacterium]|nr:4Fe-4S binding protein [Campylobacterales bacterium]